MVAKLDVTLLGRIIEELFTFHTLTLLSVLSVTIHFLRKTQRKKLNEPPLVKYKYPIIGHTREYTTDLNNFLDKCRAEHGDIFRVYVYGRVLTIVGKDHAHEVLTSKSCSFLEGFLQILPLNEMLGLGRGFRSSTPELVRQTLMGNLGVYNNRFQSILHEKIEEVFGDLKSKQINSPLEFVQGIVANAMAHILLGEEVGKTPGLMNILLDTSRAIGEAWLIPNTLSYIHPSLHRLRILWTVRLRGDMPKKNVDKLAQLIKPIIDERIRQEKKLGSMWKEPVDLLSGLLNHKKIDKSNVDYKWIAAHIQLMVFAAVHATSTIGSRCLMDYASNSKSWQELLEEQMKINPENKKFITIEEADKMEKMDSFIKETLRLSDVVAGLHHLTAETGFQFSNGYEVPANRLIAIDKRNIHLDPTYAFGNPLEFDGNRYVGKDSPSTRIARSYVAFGLGRHACPGRFFAIYEIKAMMAHLIRNFTIKPVSKMSVISLSVAGFIIPFGQLMFERRVQ